jgi:hypothetical protein
MCRFDFFYKLNLTKLIVHRLKYRVITNYVSDNKFIDKEIMTTTKMNSHHYVCMQKNLRCSLQYCELNFCVGIIYYRYIYIITQFVITLCIHDKILLLCPFPSVLPVRMLPGIRHEEISIHRWFFTGQ